MLQKETRCIKSWLLKTFEQDEDFQLFSFVEIFFFPFITALRKQQKILACFPEDKLSTIYLDLQIQKVFTPRLLMHRVPSGASVNVWTFFNSCVWVHQLSSVWKDGSQNHTVTAEKGSNMQKCWKTAESTERGGFVWRTVLSSTVQNKQGTHEQPTQNKRTVVDHPGNLTQY